MVVTISSVLIVVDPPTQYDNQKCLQTLPYLLGNKNLLTLRAAVYTIYSTSLFPVTPQLPCNLASQPYPVLGTALVNIPRALNC
jgi:hypothetical protein